MHSVRHETTDNLISYLFSAGAEVAVVGAKFPWRMDGLGGGGEIVEVNIRMVISPSPGLMIFQVATTLMVPCFFSFHESREAFGTLCFTS